MSIETPGWLLSRHPDLDVWPLVPVLKSMHLGEYSRICPLILSLAPHCLGNAGSAKGGRPLQGCIMKAKEDTIPKGTIPKGTIPKGTIPKGTIPKGTGRV